MLTHCDVGFRQESVAAGKLIIHLFFESTVG